MKKKILAMLNGKCNGTDNDRLRRLRFPIRQ